MDHSDSKVTRSRVARACGVSPSKVSRILNGTAGCSALFVSGHWNATEKARYIDVLRDLAGSVPVVVTGRRMEIDGLHRRPPDASGCDGAFARRWASMAWRVMDRASGHNGSAIPR